MLYKSYICSRRRSEQAEEERIGYKEYYEDTHKR